MFIFLVYYYRNVVNYPPGRKAAENKIISSINTNNIKIFKKIKIYFFTCGLSPCGIIRGPLRFYILKSIILRLLVTNIFTLYH
jgi:hypothetical protein